MEIETIKQEESVKLYKDETSKGIVTYKWDIKLIGVVDDAVLKRLKELNDKMLKEYNSIGVL